MTSGASSIMMGAPCALAHLHKGAPMTRTAMPRRIFPPLAATTVALAAALLTVVVPLSAAETITLGGRSYVNQGLVGVGRMPADLRDKFGETVGSGSGLAVDPTAWTRGPDGYQGVLYMLPDRGYNVGGTTDFRARLYKFSIALKPADTGSAPPDDARQRGVTAELIDTILLTDAAGQPLTALDPSQGGVRPAADGLPDLPEASTGRVSLDSEALARMPDGSFFISDEYGPYIYRFSAEGRMLSAIRPPDAFIPMRNGKAHFSSNNPGRGAPAPNPENPDTGRQNNQGFEGLTVTPDGGFLVPILQSATRQDSGGSPETRRYTRLLYYGIATIDRPRLVREYVVPLP